MVPEFDHLGDTLPAGEPGVQMGRLVADPS